MGRQIFKLSEKSTGCEKYTKLYSGICPKCINVTPVMRLMNKKQQNTKSKNEK